MKSILENEAHKTTTYNGAVVYDTSFDSLTDLFAKIGSMRHVDNPTELFRKAFKEDPITATRVLFYARDCRGGYGERKTVFKIFYDFFCTEHPEWGGQLVHWFAEMGRWKDLWEIVDMLIKDKGMEVMLDDTCIEYPSIAVYIFDTIMEQFNKDVMDAENWKSGHLEEKPSISMLGKWMPSCHSKSPNVRNLFKWFSKSAQGLTYCMGEKYYRYYTKLLRTHIGIVEHNIVSKNYAEIDYTKIPSRALKRYTTLFKKYDNERFMDIMNKASNSEVKLNVRQLYPYEILGDINFSYSGKISCDAEDAETAMWYQMPNFFKRDVSILSVLDTSYSMSGLPIKIAMALSIYTAQRNPHETFKDYIIQFSDEPHIISIKDKHSLKDIVSSFENDNGSTNFEGVMKYLLDLAVSYDIPASEMPEYLLVVSDMQFNNLACEGYSHDYYTLMEPSTMTSSVKIPMMEKIRDMYSKTKYKMPTIIYWNVDDDSPKGSFPMKHLDGCIYISGKSPVIFDHLFDERFPSTYELIKKITDSDRYNKIIIDFTKQN